jgi:hypothetical protein
VRLFVCCFPVGTKASRTGLKGAYFLSLIRVPCWEPVGASPGRICETHLGLCVYMSDVCVFGRGRGENLL